MSIIQPSVGTTLKVLVSFEVGNKTMDDCEFVCEFYTRYPGVTVTKTKSEMIRIDENNYIAVLDTREVGMGSLSCKLSVDVPDADCPGGIRREVVRTLANVNIME